jgi:hypothetical protein
MKAEDKIESIATDASKRTSERSTIEFPYLDLQNGIEIAEGVHKVGGSSCEWDQLAAHFKQAAQGGGFRLRLICAKQFGLVLYDRGKVSLTHLGLRAVDPHQQKAAKVEAFLNVPLYKAVYDRFRGSTLPPAAGLEQEMVGLGVAKKQADKARQAFHRSAKFAGFFEFGADRLVAPSLQQSNSSASVGEGAHEVKIIPAGKGGSGADADMAALHPFVIGLLRNLPEPESDWPVKDRAKWLQTAANIFDLMYAGADGGEVNIKFTPGGAA